MPKILIVEDNEDNRDMLVRRLERRGFQLLVAVDGQQGIELAHSDTPDQPVTGSCEAYPTANEIPLAIWRSSADHREAYDGDHGLQFVAKTPEAADYAQFMFRQ